MDTHIPPKTHSGIAVGSAERVRASGNDSATSGRSRLLSLRRTRDDWHILTIPHTCVPGYDFEAACEGLTDERVRMEILIDWSATAGRRVFPQFSRELHVSVEDLELDPHEPIYCGWDWGQSPAFVVTQLNAFGQWLIFPSLSPTENEFGGVYEFAERAADHLLREYAMPHGLELKDLELIHIGDPAGRAKPAVTSQRKQQARSCFEILYRGLELHMGEDDEGKPVIERKPGWGWRIVPGAVSIQARLEAMKARLTTTLRDGLPALVVDHRAEVVITGFLGGYCYHMYSDGSFSRDPDKNFHSHTFDALCYVATRLFSRPAPRREDEDDLDPPPRPAPFASQASSSWRHG